MLSGTVMLTHRACGFPLHVMATTIDNLAPTTHVRCRRCGTIAIAGDLYCIGCGDALKQRCSVCGRINDHLIANYCPYCGSPTTLAAPPVNNGE